MAVSGWFSSCATDAEIAHRYFGGLAVEGTGGDNDAPLRGRKRFDRIERVHDQIEQDLLNLDRRRFHLR